MSLGRLAFAALEREFERSTLGGPRGAATAAILPLLDRIKPGDSVAITAGSRSIGGLVPILAGLVAALKSVHAAPFIVPAMGSHGGATDEGQANLLAGLGITEASVGAPVRSSMDTVVLGRTQDGLAVHCDRLAAGADWVLAVNRVKAHTKFKGRIESGIMKMIAVGLGKHAGAAALHKSAVRVGMERAITSIARMSLSKVRFLGGVGIVEDAYAAPHTVAAFPPETLEDGEAGLLELAKRLAPKIPFDDVDLLIVDAIGKDVSGTGMDVNVTGRNRDILGDFSTTPRVKRIFVRDLTPDTAGNALGIGFADFTTDRLVANMDYQKTVINALTGLSPEKAAVPIHFATDAACLAAALDSLGDWIPETVRIVRIRDTKRLSRILVSQALAGPDRALQPLRFDEAGNLPEFP